MPLGFQRLNERVKRPNEFINFIRPLPGRDEARSKDFLERIAAIVYPVMKGNTITVMALEEFPPNREFWGRNFNAGEVIQLVLKSQDGRWLPFRQVQMVMIHELAHCKEMNHSRFFWRVRNGYAVELKALWQRGYTGDGLWGAGQGLESGAYLTTQMPDTEMIPESLCGGVYRRRRKRKAPGVETDPELRKAKRAELKQKRILKKFGPGGTSLGADEEERIRLEKAAKTKGKGKSRVAGSARARELRAAAALARFSNIKDEPKIKTEDLEDTSDTESDLPWSESEANLDEGDRSRVNAEGNRLIRVCDEEDENDENVKQEKRELMTDYFEKTIPAVTSTSIHKSSTDGPNKNMNPSLKRTGSLILDNKQVSGHIPASSIAIPQKTGLTVKETESFSLTSTSFEQHICAACSCENDIDAVICIACSNVLKPELMRNHWQCESDACQRGSYINAGDYGLCQVCGARRPISSSS